MPAFDADHTTVSTWPLLWETLRAQRRNLLIGTMIGLAWSVGKVASPVLIRFGIDRGIRDDEMLWLWAGLIAFAGLFAGSSRRSVASMRSAKPGGPRPDSASDSSATSCRCTSDTTTEPRPVS